MSRDMVVWQRLPFLWICILFGIGLSPSGAAPAQATTNYCLETFCAKPPACKGVGGGAVDLSGRTLTNVNFANRPKSYLVGANLSNTTLVGVMFANMDLSQVDFSGAKFVANKDGTRTDLSGAQLSGTCFQGADLSGANLQEATFEQTNFTCANLLDAEFGPLVLFQGGPKSRTTFQYASLGIARSTGSFLFPLDGMGKTMPSFWSQTDFTCTRFVGLDNSNFQPAGREMKQASLRGVVLDGFQFYDSATSKGVVLDGSDLSGASLVAAGLQKASMDGVTLISTDLSHANLVQADFYTETSSNLTRALLNGARMMHADLAHATLTAAKLNTVQAQHATFDRSTLQATPQDNVATIIDSQFEYATFEEAALNNVTFDRSTLSHVSFESLTLSGTQFPSCTMVGAVFDRGTLQDVSFKGAALNDASFQGTTLTATQTGAGVNYLCSQLGGSNFSNAVLKKVSFEAAVAPPDDQCCPQLQGVYCGQAVDGTVYGHTTLPHIPAGAAVTCPNQQVGQCRPQDWVLPGWKTNLCSADGREQVVWQRPDCGSPPKTVDIKDPNLKTCLQDTLFNGANQPITKAAAKSLAFLSCPGRGISDLSGLDKGNFPALKALDLSANQLSGAGDFSNFSSALQSVKLSYNRYTSLVFASGDGMPDLSHVEASNNAITSFQISPDSYLSYLDLSYNKLAGALTFFTAPQYGIQYLDLSSNQLTSVGDVSGATDARSIYLQNNRLTTIGSVQQLYDQGDGSLYYLALDGNACFQCGTLGVDPQTQAQFGCSCDPRSCASCN
ncbi:MAG: pentapeptide repeat-containing protein [Acidobacteriota bacterium]